MVVMCRTGGAWPGSSVKKKTFSTAKKTTSRHAFQRVRFGRLTFERLFKNTSRTSVVRESRISLQDFFFSPLVCGGVPVMTINRVFTLIRMRKVTTVNPRAAMTAKQIIHLPVGYFSGPRQKPPHHGPFVSSGDLVQNTKYLNGYLRISENDLCPPH